jgi:hypothetical protein
MKGIVRLAAGLAVALASLATDLSAQNLYATSIRSSGGSEITGSLYVVDSATAAARLVGPVRAGSKAIGLVAIAAHPITGVFYGITGGPATVIPRSLVTIDLATGDAEVVAPLGAAGSDLGFAPDGTLYMWVPEGNQIARVNLETGVVTPLGPSGIQGVEGGGMAVDRSGDIAWVAATGATGTLDSIDLRTGRATPGPALTRAPHADAIDNLTFSPTGVLYAVNSNAQTPSSAALVTIDMATGVVYKVGSLPDDVHGLIFGKADTGPSLSGRAWALIGLGLAAVLLILFAVFSSNRPE